MLKNEEYLDFIREKPCLACSEKGKLTKASEAHHEALGDYNRFSKRDVDYYAIPLCTAHHTLRHQKGMVEFWEEVFPAVQYELDILKMLSLNVLSYMAEFLNERYNNEEISMEDYVHAKSVVLSASSDIISLQSEIDVRKKLDFVAETVHNTVVDNGGNHE